MNMPGFIDIALEDFPRSEIWRVQTDGWQAVKGPLNFRPQFYKGMQAAFQYLSGHDRKKVTPALLEDIYHSFYRHEEAYNSDVILREGYNTYMSEFEIFLPEPGLESQAGVSEEGIRELIDTLKTSALNKGTLKKPFMKIKIDRYNLCPIYLDALNNTFEVDLRQYLLRASVGKDAYTGTNRGPRIKTWSKYPLFQVPPSGKRLSSWFRLTLITIIRNWKRPKKLREKPSGWRLKLTQSITLFVNSTSHTIFLTAMAEHLCF